MSKIAWKHCRFHELSVTELYELLALRISIFVMEQDCPYQECDGNDPESIHIMGHAPDGELIACSRILPPGLAYPEASLGRVSTKISQRGLGFGKELMDITLALIKSEYGNVPVRIAAQEYLERFYSYYGFKTITKAYLWDGIPHVDMVLEAE